MKIIFLDVDGVLNHSNSPGWEGGNWKVIDSDCFDELRRILIHTDARIVLSSTWRLSEEACKEIASHFSDVYIIGRTPALHMSGDQRNEEILAWLQHEWPCFYGWNGEKITHMAVIDDETDADLGDGSFFKTSFEEGGLTKEIADRIIEHLNK